MRIPEITRIYGYITNKKIKSHSFSAKHFACSSSRQRWTAEVQYTAGKWPRLELTTCRMLIKGHSYHSTVPHTMTERLITRSRTFSGVSRTTQNVFVQDAPYCTCATEPIVHGVIHDQHAWPSALYTKSQYPHALHTQFQIFWHLLPLCFRK